jgi:hypothetical protein
MRKSAGPRVIHYKTDHHAQAALMALLPELREVAERAVAQINVEVFDDVMRLSRWVDGWEGISQIVVMPSP